MNTAMNEQLSATSLRRIDAACDQFEAAWRDGRQPRIEDYLQLCELDERPRLLDSLQKLQQELILKQMAGERKSSPKPASSGDVRLAEDEPQTQRFPNSSVVDPSADPAPVANNPATAREQSPEETHDWDPPRVILRVVAGPHKGQEFIYDEHDTLLVGRSPRAQLRLKDDPHFSRHHFRLEANPPTCFVMDLGSCNGTFVNGERITECYLKDGDVVSGGRTKMVVSIRSPNQPPSTPEPAARRTSAPSSGQPQTTGQPARVAQHEHAVQINGYSIHEQIGTGDLGTVYRATRLASLEECALKVISPAAKADEKSIQTFLREASILNQLQHQYIVRMIEMGASGSDLYLSTEYLSTISWESLAARWSPTQRIKVACGIMAQILGALEYAHARSMVHRDVKPGNILISRLDGKLLGKLADFGLAKHYTTAGMSQMTREGDVIGSLPYMSPEQFINSREAKPSCDLDSAGATLYWMISGHEPIRLENHPCKFLAILEDPPTPLESHCPEVPVELARLVHRSLEKSPEKRFTSTAEMRQQIRKFAN